MSQIKTEYPPENGTKRPKHVGGLQEVCMFLYLPIVVVVVVVVVVLVVGAYQHCSHEGLLYSNPPMEFCHSSPEALHT
jgi:hypothetical protein